MVKKIFRYMLPLSDLVKYFQANEFEVVFSESKPFEEGTEGESADRELAVLVKNT